MHMIFMIIAQAVGVVAMTVVILSYQCKRNKSLFLMQTASTLIWAVHFFMLGAYTGVIMNIIGSVRCFVMYNRGKKWADSKITLALLIAMVIGGSAIGFSFPMTLVSVVSMIISVLSMWTNDSRKIRLYQLFVVSPMWLVYDALAGAQPSVAGIITELFSMASIIISIKRFGLMKSEQTQK